MAKKPTHYKLTVTRSLDVANARFRPGARYLVTAAIYTAIKQDHADAVAKADPIIQE